MDGENTLEYDIAELQESSKILEGERKISEKIQKLIDTNKLTIGSILVLIPSISIPMYHDWRHPVIGMGLGVLSQITIALMSIEQIAKQKGEKLV